MKRKIKTFITLLTLFGIPAAIEYVLTKIILQPWFPFKSLSKRRKIYRAVPGIRYPICTRLETSDEEMFSQCFIHGEYNSLTSMDPNWIIDCGGYIGLSSVWFLNKFPNARVVIIEPDPENFAVLKANVSPYKDRVIAINAAIWNTKTMLVLEKGVFGDKKDWSNQTKPSDGTTAPSVPTVTIGELINAHSIPQVDILKIDIERAEIPLFSGDASWLSSIKNIAIELHDDECVKTFFNAMTPFVYEKQQIGDLTLCLNISPAPN